MKVNGTKTKSKGFKRNESERSQIDRNRIVHLWSKERPIFLETVHFQGCPLKTGTDDVSFSLEKLSRVIPEFLFGLFEFIFIGPIKKKLVLRGR